MSRVSTVVVVGMGEVGRPILDLVARQHRAIGVDVSPQAEPPAEVDILHICYPFGIEDFVGETARYIARYKPGLTIINSTVAVGTTREVALRTNAAVVHSPVRGKHPHMTEDLRRYVKFVGGVNASDAESAVDHFRSIGMKSTALSSPEATELAKLTETTYFGLMIAWAQEIERYCDQLGQDYHDIVSFYKEIGFFPPVKYVPGVIGGHCVMPNLKILLQLGPSEILEAIESSNKQKIARELKRVNERATDEAPIGAGITHGVEMAPPSSRSIAGG